MAKKKQPDADIQIKATEIQVVDIGSVKLNPVNRNHHPQEQIDELAEHYKFYGMRTPLVVSKQTNFVVAGNGRYLAAVRAGMKQVPVTFQDFSNPEEEYGFGIADNGLGKWSELDMKAINMDLQDFNPEFDLRYLGLEDFKLDVSEHNSSLSDSIVLHEKFGAPPFTVLDSRQGYWNKRKKMWNNLGIDSTKGRDEHLIASMKNIGNGGFEYMAPSTSTFDPVLCEVIYRWFSNEDHVVVDPFSGGSVRGIVASKIKRNYIGLDIRQEQIHENKNQAELICTDHLPHWIVSDSQYIKNVCPNIQADLVFSCPPYFNLEVYSDDPDDLSNMEWNEFLKTYRKIIFESCGILKNNRFACFVVGEIRDKNGYYRNFVGETVNAFVDAGLKLYNEAVLINSFGTAALRADKTFMSGRKMIKCHQNVLVFVKGDPKIATTECGDVFVDDSLIFFDEESLETSQQ